MATGKSRRRPVNEAWNRRIIEAMIAGNLEVLDELDNDTLSQDCGSGGHETRNWVAALSAWV